MGQLGHGVNAAITVTGMSRTTRAGGADTDGRRSVARITKLTS
ncbi:hypothetical protein PT2222_330017 [Paraburkholderia tropica]